MFIFESIEKNLLALSDSYCNTLYNSEKQNNTLFVEGIYCNAGFECILQCNSLHHTSSAVLMRIREDTAELKKHSKKTRSGT